MGTPPDNHCDFLYPLDYQTAGDNSSPVAFLDTEAQPVKPDPGILQVCRRGGLLILRVDRCPYLYQPYN